MKSRFIIIGLLALASIPVCRAPPTPQYPPSITIATPGYTGTWPPPLPTAAPYTIATSGGKVVPWPPVTISPTSVIATPTESTANAGCLLSTTALSVNRPVPTSTTNDTSGEFRKGTAVLMPHVEYSSSIGVLGCMINTDRVAYWPFFPDCNNMCVKLWLPGSSENSGINVLHIDSTRGAYDISMDAFKTLKYGTSWKTTHPGQEDPLRDVNYRFMPLDQCPELIPADGKLPFIANAPNHYLACPAGSFTHEKAQLWDIQDQTCHKGILRKCKVPVGQQVAYCDGEMAGFYGTWPQVAPALEGIHPVVNIDNNGNEAPS